MPSRFECDALGNDRLCIHNGHCVTRQSTSTAGVITWSGEIIPTGTMCSASTMTGRHRDHRIEIARRQRVGEISQIVGEKRLQQREVGAQRFLEQDTRAIDFDLALPSSTTVPTPVGVSTRLTEATGANALDQRALRYQLDFDLACQHLFCVSGFNPMLAITLRTAFAVISLPIPIPGNAVSLPITVNSRLPWCSELVITCCSACRRP